MVTSPHICSWQISKQFGCGMVFFNYYYSINMGKLHTLTHVRARGTQIHQSPLRRIEEETDPLAPGAGSKFSFFPACFWVSCRAVLTLCCLNESRGLFHSQVAAGLNTCRWLGADRGFNEVFWLQQKSHTQRFFKLHHSRVVGCCTTNQKVADWVKKKMEREREKKISIRH